MRIRIPSLKGIVAASAKILPLAIGGAFLLSFGPELQHYVFSTIDSNKISIYEAAYGSGIVEIPSFFEWIFGAFIFPYLPVAAVCASIAAYQKTFGKFVLIYFVSLFLCLIFVDLFSYFLSGKSNNGSLAENFVADFAGAQILALTVGAIVIISHQICAIWISAGRVRSVLVGLVFISLSLTCSGVTYAIIKFVYNPIPVQIEASMKQKSTSIFGPTSKQDAQIKVDGDDRVGMYLPKKAISGDSMAEGDTVSLAWEGDTRIKYSAKISYYSNCAWAEIPNLPKAKNYITKKGFSKLNLNFGRNVAFLRLKNLSLSRYIYDIGQFATFGYVDKSKDGNFSVTNFMDEKDKVTISSDGELVIWVSLPLMKVQGQKRSYTPSDRRVEGNFGDEKVSWNFRRIGKLDEYRGVKCAPIENIDRPGNFVDAGVRIAISPEVVAGVVASEAKLSLNVRRGSFRVDEISGDDLNNERIGTGSYFGTSDSISKLTVNGKEERIGTDPSFWARGNLVFSYGGPGEVNVTGQADLVWIGEKRLNPTHWESLPDGWPLWLIGAFIAGIAATIRWCWTKLAKHLDDGLEVWLN